MSSCGFTTTDNKIRGPQFGWESGLMLNCHLLPLGDNHASGIDSMERVRSGARGVWGLLEVHIGGLCLRTLDLCVPGLLRALNLCIPVMSTGTGLPSMLHINYIIIYIIVLAYYADMWGFKTKCNDSCGLRQGIWRRGPEIGLWLKAHWAIFFF